MAEAKKTTTAKKSTTTKSTTVKKTVAKPVEKKTTAKTTVKKTSPSKKTVEKKVTPKKAEQLLMDVQKITKYYGKVEVLRGIDFKVNKGERIAIVGANGAGKSTLSEIIARVKAPTGGVIKYYFEEKGEESVGKGAISKHIGIQFQDSSYPDFYKVNDLVNFIIGAAKLDISKEELDDMYQTFDLDKLRYEVAKGLSGGQQQRLNIFLAVVNNPSLLILDEVGTGLDVESRTKIKSYIKNYAAEHEATILLVSHNSDEVMELVDRVITIHNGEIYQDQMLSEIIKKYDHFDNYMNDLYLNVFKKDLDMRANKSGRQDRKLEKAKESK